MTRQRWGALVAAVLLAVLAVYVRHLDLDDLLDGLPGDTDEPAREARIALGIAAIVCVLTAFNVFDNNSPLRRGRVLLLIVAGLLVLGAVYLQHLPFDDLVTWLWGSEYAKAEAAEAVTWMRWALAILALVVVVTVIGAHWVELVVALVVSLVAIAAVGATGELLGQLDARDVEDPDKSAFDRGFLLPAEKVQPVARELAADRCVRLILVKAVDEDTADERNALRQESSEYGARLVSKLGDGTPSAAVAVELGGTDLAKAFATDLVSANAVFVISSNVDQSATETPDSCR